MRVSLRRRWREITTHTVNVKTPEGAVSLLFQLALALDKATAGLARLAVDDGILLGDRSVPEAAIAGMEKLHEMELIEEDGYAHFLYIKKISINNTQTHTRTNTHIHAASAELIHVIHTCY